MDSENGSHLDATLFTDLPADIKIQIYELVLVEEDGIDLTVLVVSQPENHVNRHCAKRAE